MNQSDIASTRVLFVCLGNICRSPLAEGVLIHLLEEEGLDDANLAITPVMHPVQTTACAPLARAWHLLCEATSDPAKRIQLARDNADAVTAPMITNEKLFQGPPL